MENTFELTLPGSNFSMPYSARTPRAITRERFSLNVLNEEDEITDDLIDLLNQTWTIFGISAWFNFQQDDLHSKLYAKRLREEVANSLSQEDVSYDATFVLMNAGNSGLIDNAPTVKIEVNAKTRRREEDIEKCIYKGVYMSGKTHSQANAVHITRFPLLLCRGSHSCMNAVHNTISRLFDCMVIPLPAAADDLMWLVPIAIAPSKDGESMNGEIRMEYIIPELPPTDTIITKFRIPELVTMLTGLYESSSDASQAGIVLEAEHVEKFHKVIHKQMLKIAGLQLGHCSLHRIQLPGLTIMENRMKVTNIEIMNRILLYLNEKALHTFHTLDMVLR